VIVSPEVNFLCQKAFKAFDNQSAASVKPNAKFFAKAKSFFKVNSDRLPSDNKRLPLIVQVPPSNLKQCVVTTDFFGFDTSDDHFGLQGHGDISEMGDAILGLLAKETTQANKTFPRWVAVRNVSDPQIKNQGTVAAHIYKAFGRWSSVCSAIVCWALIAAEP